MVSGPKQLMCILGACAALAAQVAPAAFCPNCDLPCCGAPAGGVPAASVDSDQISTGDCPLCGAAATPDDRCSSDPAGQPCRCQLDARQDHPNLPFRRTHTPADQADKAAAAAGTELQITHAPGISREYLATLLAAPIRPTRILFGVWRD